MEEKKLNELSDEALDQVAGGAEGERSRPTCPNCGRGHFPKSVHGIHECLRCGAIITFAYGKVQSFEVPAAPTSQYPSTTHGTPSATELEIKFQEYETPL